MFFRRKQTALRATAPAPMPELAVLNGNPAHALKLEQETRTCPTCAYLITNPMNDRCPRCFTTVPLSEHTNCGECSHQGNCTYADHKS